MIKSGEIDIYNSLIPNFNCLCVKCGGQFRIMEISTPIIGYKIECESCGRRRGVFYQLSYEAQQALENLRGENK